MNLPQILMILGLVVATATAHAESARVSLIERSVKRLARTRLGDQEIVVASGKKATVWLRPRANVIAISRHGFFDLSQHAMFLGADGRLSASDHAALERVLATNAPSTSVTSVRSAISKSMKQFKSRERELKRQDPMIRTLTHTASGINGKDDVEIWSNGKASLTYRPSAGILVGSRGFTQTGFWVKRGPNGVAIAPESLDGLREFLLTHR